MAYSNSSSEKPGDGEAIKSIKGLGLKPTAEIEAAAKYLEPPPARVLWFFRPLTESAERQKLMEVRKEFLVKAMKNDLDRTKESNRHEEAMNQLCIEREKAKKVNGYVCRIESCGASFSDDDKLVRHFQQFHTGVKCRFEQCGASFEDDSKLAAHFQECHAGKMMQCPEKGCPTFFVDINALFKHVAQAHNGQFKSE